jgi:hypothetical protein
MLRTCSLMAATLVIAVVAPLGQPARAQPVAVAEDASASREAEVGGVRFVLLGVSREVVLTGDKTPAKAFRHRLRFTFLVERLEEPKKAEELHLGEIQIFLAGTEKRADQEANNVHVKGYPLDKYPYADRMQVPKVRNTAWASIYELEREPLKKVEGGAIDIRVKGVGIGDRIGSCEFRKIPLE